MKRTFFHSTSSRFGLRGATLRLASPRQSAKFSFGMGGSPENFAFA